jgi:2-oxoglutarate ferredoxin oxidoreductase subunit beta
MRKNIDLLYIVMNNETYGLTVGQASPTTQIGEQTYSTPFGNIETPLNPVALAIVAGATYVARAFSSERDQLVELMYNGMQHKGFSFIDVISPCVTWKPDEIFAYWKERVNFLENHDASDKAAALEQAVKDGHETQLGLFYHDTSRPSLEQLEPVLENGPMAHQPLGITPEQGASIIQRMM